MVRVAGFLASALAPQALAHSMLRDNVQEIGLLGDGVSLRREALASYGSPSQDDCQMTEWLQGTCDPATLTAVFTRSIQRGPLGNGAPCGKTSEVRKCKPVHCQMTPWTPWSACNVKGYKTRKREIEVPPSGGGRSCPYNVDTVKCCAGSCLVYDWGDWICNEQTARKTRTREKFRDRSGNGEPCPVLTQEDDCDPVDCVMDTEYGDWSECDVHGDRFQKLKVKVQPKFKGKECPPDSEITKVDKQYCPPEPCEWETEDQASNRDYGNCLATDDSQKTWYQYKILQITKQPRYGAGDCPSDDQRTIKKLCPPTECKIADVDESKWGECKKDDTQNKWFKRQVRDIIQDAQYAPPCPSETDRTAVKECEPEPCEWETEEQAKSRDYGECKPTDESKKTWYQYKELKVTKDPLYGGKECPSVEDRTIKQLCPPTQCQLADKDDSKWSQCSKDDKDGKWYRTQVLSIVQEAQYAPPCPLEADRTLTEECKPEKCEWETEEEAKSHDFGDCKPTDETEETWFKYKVLKVTKDPLYGADPCPSDDERTIKEQCPPTQCKIADVDESKWGECKKDDTQNKWFKKQVRDIIQDAQYAPPCPSETDRTAVKECEPEPCEWETEEQAKSHDYGECKPTDESKTTWYQYKELKVTKDPLYGGKECPSVEDRTIKQLCPPTQCEVGDKDDYKWSDCKEDKTRGKWYKTQVLPIVQDAQYAPPCPSEADRTIEDECKPVDCVVYTEREDKSSFSDDCTPDDESGLKWYRHKVLGIKQQPLYGGKACPKPEDRTCQQLCKPEPCVMDKWVYTGQCNKSTGRRPKARKVAVQARYGSPSCVDQVGEDPCKVDCEFTWGDWSKCTSYTPTKTRKKVISVQPKNGGATCEPLTETKKC